MSQKQIVDKQEVLVEKKFEVHAFQQKIAVLMFVLDQMMWHLFPSAWKDQCISHGFQALKLKKERYLNDPDWQKVIVKPVGWKEDYVSFLTPADGRECEFCELMIDCENIIPNFGSVLMDVRGFSIYFRKKGFPVEFAFLQGTNWRFSPVPFDNSQEYEAKRLKMVLRWKTDVLPVSDEWKAFFCEHGIITVADLVKMSEFDLFDMKGVGFGGLSLGNLKSFFKNTGLSFGMELPPDLASSSATASGF